MYVGAKTEKPTMPEILSLTNESGVRGERVLGRGGLWRGEKGMAVTGDVCGKRKPPTADSKREKGEKEILKKGGARAKVGNQDQCPCGSG